MGCSNSVAHTPAQSAEQGDQMPDSMKAMLLKLGKEFSGELKGPCLEGMQHEQCEKLVASVRSADPPLVEMRSYFVRMHSSTKSMKERLMGEKVKYAEFATSLDMPQGIWTIQKVFLNDVLPQGQKLGARAVAEHLTCVAQYGMSELQAVHLSDVVNLNTYMLMMIASSSDRSPKNVFGEHMLGVFQQELCSSGMTLHQLQTFTFSEVFQNTVLGKLVANVLKLWNSTTDREFRIENVDVKISNSIFERICGEMRPSMDIHVTLSNEDSWIELKGDRERQITVSTMASETMSSETGASM